MTSKLPEKPISKGAYNYKISKKFETLADRVDKIIGTPYWFAFSLLMVLVWFPSGLFIGFGEIWHLIINTSTTILTFLMMALLHASESKYEKHMEKMEEAQRVTLNFLKKETERIAALEEAHLTNAEQIRYIEQKTSSQKEHISSLN